MQEHTPGPWEAEEAARWYDPQFIRTAADAVPIAIVGNWFEWSRIEQQRANARLIAAAPELFTEASLLCTELESTGESWRASRLRAAIAQALGKAVSA